MKVVFTDQPEPEGIVYAWRSWWLVDEDGRIRGGPFEHSLQARQERITISGRRTWPMTDAP